jgi:hypothetical protein
LPIPYDSKFEDYDLPVALDAVDYPNLIKPGERVMTIAVPTALVAFNFPAKSNRFHASRASSIICSRGSTNCGSLASTRNGNRSATVPGLMRFPAAQAWLDRQPRAAHVSQ